MQKEVRYAVSFIIYDPKGNFLVVKRPKGDKELPLVWGLPATNYDPRKETPEKAVIRGAKEKLNCEVEIFRALPQSMIQDRKGYSLMMMDYECRLIGGTPDVNAARTKGTRYIEQKWVSDLDILVEGKEKGSACIQLYFADKGLMDPREFKTSI